MAVSGKEEEPDDRRGDPLALDETDASRITVEVLWPVSHDLSVQFVMFLFPKATTTR